MRRIASFVIAAVCGIATPAAAQSITLGTTANPAPAAAFMADQLGLFKKNGLELTVQIVTADPTIPAALVSNSVQLASVTPTTFLTAASRGIDLVALAGTAITTKSSHDVAIVASKSSGITDPKGFEGKTVGVPGIGAVLDVMLHSWLELKGVDVSKVKFIELPFSQQADQLKAGRVDGVITVEQFAQRMLSDGFGTLVSSPLADLPEGLIAQAIVSQRAWANDNAKAVAAVRQSLKEAEQMAKADPEKVRAALGNAMKLPPPVVQRMALPVVDTSISAAQLEWWAKTMKHQGLLKADVDPAHLILP